MLKNLAKYTTTACLASVMALTAQAELAVNKPMASEQAMNKAMPVKATPMAKPVAKPMMKSAPKMMAKPMAKPMHEHKMHTEMAVNKPMKSEAMMAKPFKADNTMNKDMGAAKTAPAPMMASHEWLHDGNNFVKIKGGVAQPMKFGGTSEIDNKGAATFVVGAAIGRKFMDCLSLDLEYMHRDKSKVTYENRSNEDLSTKKWAVKSDTIMANITADLIQNSSIRPYVKLGIGASRNKADTYSTADVSYIKTNPGKTMTSFSWQAGFGMNFDYNAAMATELEYSFVNRGKFAANLDGNKYDIAGESSAPSTSDKNGKLKDHVVTFGIKLKF